MRRRRVLVASAGVSLIVGAECTRRWLTKSIEPEVEACTDYYGEQLLCALPYRPSVWQRVKGLVTPIIPVAA